MVSKKMLIVLGLLSAPILYSTQISSQQLNASPIIKQNEKPFSIEQIIHNEKDAVDKIKFNEGSVTFDMFNYEHTVKFNEFVSYIHNTLCLQSDSEKEDYIDDFLNKTTPISANSKYDWEMSNNLIINQNDTATVKEKKQKNVQRIIETRKSAKDTHLLLAIRLQESGLDLKASPHGNCYGDFQIKKEVWEHVIRYVNFNLPKNEAEKYSRITWESVKNNNLSSQVMILEKYLDILEDWLKRELPEKKIDITDLESFVLASYNLGPRVVVEGIKKVKGDNLTWKQTRRVVCSYSNIKQYGDILGINQTDTRDKIFKKMIITPAYVESCHIYKERLADDLTRIIKK